MAEMVGSLKRKSQRNIFQEARGFKPGKEKIKETHIRYPQIQGLSGESPVIVNIMGRVCRTSL